MIDLTWDLYARQLLGVLASGASAFLFLALLAFEWQRMQTLRDCRDAAAQLTAHYDEIRKQRAEKRREKEKLLGGTGPRVMATVVKKLADGT